MTKKFAKIKKETNKQTNKQKRRKFILIRDIKTRTKPPLYCQQQKIPLKFPERGIIKPLSGSFLPLTDYNCSCEVDWHMSSDLDCRPRARACANLVPIPRALKNYMEPP